MLQILLLDEATSALDAASEAIVTQALNDLARGGKAKSSGLLASAGSSTPLGRKSLGGCSASSLEKTTSSALPCGRTTIIVAHRLTTITAADTIAVLSPGGKVLELGSPAELLGNGPEGHYAQMVMQQHHATPLVAAAAALHRQ